MIATFFYTCFEALTRPAAYLRFAKRSMWGGVLYLYVLNVIVITLGFTPILYGFPAQLTKFSQSVELFTLSLTRSYPRDLEIEIGSDIRSSRPEPINIPLAADRRTDSKQIVLTINTALSLQDAIRSESMIVLAHEYVVLHPEDRRQTAALVIEAKRIPPMKITFASIISALSDLQKSLRMIQSNTLLIGLLVGGVLSTIFAAIVTMIHLVQLALLNWVVLWYARIIGYEMSYGTLYRMGIYGLTFPILCTTLLGFTPYSFPLALSAGFILCMAVVVSMITNTQSK